jgi:hypothetical protein
MISGRLVNICKKKLKEGARIFSLGKDIFTTSTTTIPAHFEQTKNKLCGL